MRCATDGIAIDADDKRLVAAMRSPASLSTHMIFGSILCPATVGIVRQEVGRLVCVCRDETGNDWRESIRRRPSIAHGAGEGTAAARARTSGSRRNDWRRTPRRPPARHTRLIYASLLREPLAKRAIGSRDLVDSLLRSQRDRTELVLDPSWRLPTRNFPWSQAEFRWKIPSHQAADATWRRALQDASAALYHHEELQVAFGVKKCVFLN